MATSDEQFGRDQDLPAELEPCRSWIPAMNVRVRGLTSACTRQRQWARERCGVMRNRWTDGIN